MTTPVYTGRWTDWSYGSILGDRVTMSNNNAGILVAFIAIFDSVVGGFAWSLVAYLLHRSRASLAVRDGLYHQHQVLLRNSASATAFATLATEAGWKWRGLAPKALQRSVLLSTASLSVSLLFTVAGILSSQIANTGQVLLVGGDCGGIVTDGSMTPDQSIAFQGGEILNSAHAMDVSQNYAEVCYNNQLDLQASVLVNQLQSKGSCECFVQPTLNYTITLGMDSCPFGDWCEVPPSEVLVLDTGILDSHVDLGQNQPPSNRVQFRRRQICAPMRSNMTVYSNVTGLEVLGEISFWSYGSNYLETNSMLRLGEYPDYPGVTFLYSQASDAAADSPYYLNVASTLDFRETEDSTFVSNFSPSPKLVNNDTTPLSVFLLGNRAVYWNETKDVWFNGTSTFSSFAANVNVTLWSNQNIGGMLGCLEEGQICNPNNKQCTDMTSWYTWQGIPQAFNDIGLNDIQMAIASGIHNTWETGNAFSVVTQLGDTSLVANQYFATRTQGISPALPINQWQIEATNWFGISMAAIQTKYVAQNRKPVSNEAYLAFWEPYAADDEIDQNLCSSQKVNSSAFQSFSVLGLALNFVLGGLIMIASFVVTTLTPDLQKSKKDKPNRKQWVANGVLQLQRTAYERLGLGEWEGDEGDVPVTKRGQKFKAHVLESKNVSSSHPLSFLSRGSPAPNLRAPDDASTQMLNPHQQMDNADDRDDLSYRPDPTPNEESHYGYSQYFDRKGAVVR